MLFATARASEKVSQDRSFTVQVDGIKRYYQVHAPPNYDGARAWPVVLSFHGAAGRPEVQRTQTRLDPVADRNGFLVVYPQGTGWLNMFFWNAGACCGPAVKQKIDDVKFVRVLLGDLAKNYSVDTRRVFACGISNGAMFSYRLACELPDRIAAIGAVAGAMQIDGPKPSRPVPVIHFHGQKDPFARYDGGAGPNGVQHRPVRETIGWWLDVNHCQTQPVNVVRRKDFVREEYAPVPGQDGAPVVLVTLPEGGHTWPGGVDVTPRLNTGTLVASVDASSLLWEFFQAHPLPERK
jgi:polyhydroxybutyrate depolymerase